MYYLVHFLPDDSRCWISRYGNIQSQFVPSHHNNCVRGLAQTVQVDFGRLFKKGKEKRFECCMWEGQYWCLTLKMKIWNMVSFAVENIFSCIWVVNVGLTFSWYKINLYLWRKKKSGVRKNRSENSFCTISIQQVIKELIIITSSECLLQINVNKRQNRLFKTM